MAASETIEAVSDVVVTVLEIPERRGEFTADTALFGALPELDSLAVLELISALEERFGIEISGDAVTAEHFGDVGSLSELVESLRG